MIGFLVSYYTKLNVRTSVVNYFRTKKDNCYKKKVCEFAPLSHIIIKVKIKVGHSSPTLSTTPTIPRISPIYNLKRLGCR